MAVNYSIKVVVLLFSNVCELFASKCRNSVQKNIGHKNSFKYNYLGLVVNLNLIW